MDKFIITFFLILQTQMNPLVAAFYDAVTIYAWAYNQSLYSNENMTQNEKITKFLWNNVFTDGK